MIRIFLAALTLLSMMVCPANGQAQVIADQNVPTRWTTHWQFDDVNVAKLLSNLSWLGLEVPFQVEGRISVNLTIGVPYKRLRDAEAYEASGTIESDSLTIDSLHLTDFIGNAKIQSGVLTIDDLSALLSTRKATSQSSTSEAKPKSLAMRSSREPVAIGSHPAEHDELTGKLSGLAQIDLLDQPNRTQASQLELKLDSIPIEPVIRIIQAFEFTSSAATPSGRLTGKISIETPSNHLVEMPYWEGDASLSIDQLEWQGLRFPSVSIDDAQFHDSEIYVGKLSVNEDREAGSILEGTGHINLKGQRPFELQVLSDDLPLEELSDRILPTNPSGPPLAEGTLDLQIKASGQLGGHSDESPDAQIDIMGLVASPSLCICGLKLGLLEHSLRLTDNQIEFHPVAQNTTDDRVKLRSMTARVNRKSGLGLKELNAEVFGGRISGSLHLPDASSVASEVHLRWEDVEAEVASSVIGLETISKDSCLALKSSGKVDWLVPASDELSIFQHSGETNLIIESLSIDDREIMQGEITASASGTDLEVNATGETLGGEFTISTHSNAELDTLVQADRVQQTSWWKKTLGATEGIVQFESMDLLQLAKLAETLGQTPTTKRVRGSLSGLFDLSSHRASITARGLSYRGNLLSQRITANASLIDDHVSIDSIEGSYAGGTVRMVGRWALRRGSRSLQVSLSRIDIHRGLALVDEKLAETLGGKLSGRMTITNGDAYRARGSMTVHQSSVSNLKTGDLHSTFSASATPNLGRWHLAMPGISGSVAGGRIEGRVNLKSAGGRAGYDLESNLRVRRSDFGVLLSGAGIGSRFAHGFFTGSIKLWGQRIKSISDLRGFFEADLSKTEGDAVPGIVGMDRFLSAIPLTQTQFGDGYVRGNLRRGVANIEEFWLRNRRVRIFAEGDITLASNRMNLDAVVATGDMQFDSEPLAALATQIAIQAVIPIAAITEINRILSDRTIYFNIRGTSSNPIVRLKPFETIRENAARFFYREIANAAATSIGVDVWN
ncbi:MAG: AsmA-like C-terminal region-containing protein [Planctomycetota bacterium]